jgi:hypothetical protein
MKVGRHSGRCARELETMKTTRIKIESGQIVELCVRRDQETVRYYSSVAIREGSRDAEPVKKLDTGLRATLTICGPAEICCVVSEKK